MLHGELIEGITVLLDARGRLHAVTLPPSPPSAFNGRALARVLARLQRLPFDWDRFTSFQRDIYHRIVRISPGKTIAYAELAQTAGHPGAARAAASACARNPVPLFIPCHRVIASDGSPGGFSAGLAWKLRLLEIEATTT